MEFESINPENIMINFPRMFAKQSTSILHNVVSNDRSTLRWDEELKAFNFKKALKNEFFDTAPSKPQNTVLIGNFAMESHIANNGPHITIHIPPLVMID